MFCACVRARAGWEREQDLGVFSEATRCLEDISSENKFHCVALRFTSLFQDMKTSLYYSDGLEMLRLYVQVLYLVSSMLLIADCGKQWLVQTPRLYNYYLTILFVIKCITEEQNDSNQFKLRCAIAMQCCYGHYLTAMSIVISCFFSALLMYDQSNFVVVF